MSCIHDDLLWGSIFQFIVVFPNSYLSCALSLSLSLTHTHTHTCLIMGKVAGINKSGLLIKNFKLHIPALLSCHLFSRYIEGQLGKLYS